MTGTFPPETANPLPATVVALTVTASIPVDESVSDCAAAVPTATFPKERFDALMLNPGVIAFSCRENDCDVPFAFADNITVSGELTAFTVAINAALLAPAATCTAVGTLTAVLLLIRLMESPLLGAVAVSVTVQLSVPAPVIVPLAHVSALREGVVDTAPVPLSPTRIAAPLGSLLATANCPLAVPALVGEKLTPNWTVAPAASVSGKSPSPFTENACPVTVTFAI